MHRVVEHVDRNLDQVLDLAGLASVANFSSRITSTGSLPRGWGRPSATTSGCRSETGALRLSTAADDDTLRRALRRLWIRRGVLACVSRPLRELAHGMAHGRARPAASGEQSRSGGAQTRSGRSSRRRLSWEFPQREARMNVKLMDRAPAHVAYLSHVGEFGEPVSRFWQERVFPWMVTNNLVGRPRYGVSHDDPAITASDKRAMMPPWRSSRAFPAPATTTRRIFPAAASPARHSRARRRTSARHGRACFAIGCRKAASSSTRGRSTSTTQRTTRSIPGLEYSPARSSFLSPHAERPASILIPGYCPTCI